MLFFPFLPSFLPSFLPFFFLPTFSCLKQLSDRFKVPVVCVNQVTDVVSDEQGRPRRIIPALGHLWSDMVNCRFWLERQHERRLFHTVLAAHLPPSSCEVMIDDAGIHGLSS